MTEIEATKSLSGLVLTSDDFSTPDAPSFDVAGAATWPNHGGRPGVELHRSVRSYPGTVGTYTDSIVARPDGAGSVVVERHESVSGPGAYRSCETISHETLRRWAAQESDPLGREGMFGAAWWNPLARIVAEYILKPT